MISDDLKTYLGKANVLAQELSSTPADPKYADDAVEALRKSLNTSALLADYAARCGKDFRDQIDTHFDEIIPLSLSSDEDVAMAHRFGAVRWASDDQIKSLEAEFPGVECPRYAIMRVGAYKLRAQGEIGAALVDQVEWLTHNSNWLFGGSEHGIGTPRATVAVTVKTVLRSGRWFKQPGTAIPNCVTLSEPLTTPDRKPLEPFYDSNGKVYDAVREYMRDLHRTANQAWHTPA